MSRHRVEVVTIGDELLLGFTVDSNAAFLSLALGAIGYEVVRRATVGDRAEEISDAVGEALARTGAVITTGGLGPTADDLTKSAIAQFFGRKMVLDKEILRALEARWAGYFPGRRFPSPNRSQAEIPEGATVLPNRHGSAPGIWLEDDAGRWVAMLPGVPREMRGLLEDELLPVLRRRGGEGVILSRTLRTTGIGESAVAEMLGVEPLAGLAAQPPLTLAYLPGAAGVDLRITARGGTRAESETALAAAAVKLLGQIGRYVYGEDDADLAAVVLNECRKRGYTIAVAESCTGGLLGRRLTEIAGASDVFLGGITAYQNSLKERLLGVRPATLAQFGAVSEQTAGEMAAGVRQVLGADVALAITGIAGPGGGTAEKPVGTVCVAVEVADKRSSRSLRFIGDRHEIRERSAQMALEMLRIAVQTG